MASSSPGRQERTCYRYIYHLCLTQDDIFCACAAHLAHARRLWFYVLGTIVHRCIIIIVSFIIMTITLCILRLIHFKVFQLIYKLCETRTYILHFYLAYYTMFVLDFVSEQLANPEPELWQVVLVGKKRMRYHLCYFSDLSLHFCACASYLAHERRR